ncbi:MAG: ABC transporter permease [Candidatus Thiodiazotropha sp. (ex Ctena orbiculata)]|nr:ABC transporter permease [Candidatus Thiodiazotropha taylori]
MQLAAVLESYLIEDRAGYPAIPGYGIDKFLTLSVVNGHRSVHHHSLKITYPDPATAELAFVGDWTLHAEVCPWQHLQQQLQAQPRLKEIRLVTVDLGSWDSRLLNVLQKVSEYCADREYRLDTDDLPVGIRRLLDLGSAVAERKGARRSDRRFSILYRTGETAIAVWQECLRFTEFAGELVLSLWRLIRGRARFRSDDFFSLLQAAGPEALPIVSLIAILVGAVLAFVGAVQLQMFGAEIYVANLVTLGSLREMGAMMTAIIMAGRTGSAYAAQLGSMQVNHEIDALKTFGISIIDFLVLPRMIALVIMLPLLTLWADLLGIIGGLMVSVLVLDLSLLEYVVQSRESVGWEDLTVGLIKSVLFAIVIAMSGCLRGLQSGRDSAAVGKATTSAMVTAILLIVVWDAITTILFNLLDF